MTNNVNNHKNVRNNSYLLYLSFVLDFRKRTPLVILIIVITSSSVLMMSSPNCHWWFMVLREANKSLVSEDAKAM